MWLLTTDGLYSAVRKPGSNGITIRDLSGAVGRLGRGGHPNGLDYDLGRTCAGSDSACGGAGYLSVAGMNRD